MDLHANRAQGKVIGRTDSSAYYMILNCYSCFLVLVRRLLLQQPINRCGCRGRSCRHAAPKAFSLTLGKRVPLWNSYLFTVALLCGCAHRLATGPQDAFREVAPPVLSDDLSLSGLNDAIKAQSHVLEAKSSELIEVGPVAIPRGEYATALERLSRVLDSNVSESAKLSYIADNFRFFEFAGGEKPGRVLLTGYFEPILQGSKSKTSRFSRPLYRKPDDLVSVGLHAFSERFKDEKPLKARVEAFKVVPYYSRAEIDGKGSLAGRGLELAWVDPIDAFFLHIQGSGTVIWPDGHEQHLVYSDKNGHMYQAIGKFLKGTIAPHPVTMPRIERVLRSMSSQERDRVLFLNPSYVFFSPSQRRAITSMGIPATPGRTIAVDPRFAPKGALSYMIFQKPLFRSDGVKSDDPISFSEAARFVLDQDSGGAITGTGRVDLFWGRGDEAKRHAGVMQHPARIMYLIPR